MSRINRGRVFDSEHSFPDDLRHKTQTAKIKMFGREENFRSFATNQRANFQNTLSLARIVFDSISLIILLIVTIVAHSVAKPFDRGFFCSDTSIKFPYKSDTIPTYAAVLLSIGVPLLGIFLTEISKFFYFRLYPRKPFITRLEVFRRSIEIGATIRNLYILMVVFFYGYLATWLLTETTKNFVGALRPHFLARCQPTVSCSSLTTLNDFNRLLQFSVDFTCLNTDEDQVREARRSFFSGHSSSMFYGCFWLIMYLHVAWSWRHFGILKNLLQVGLVVLASYVGYTRLMDYKHHWQDVLFGAFVGSLVAFFTFKFILNWIERNTTFLPHVVTSKPTPFDRPTTRRNLVY